MITSRLVLVSMLAVLPGLSQADKETESHFGWDVAALGRIDPASQGYATHATILVHGSGEVLWKWGNTSEVVRLFSVRKSLVSALYGVAVARGEVNVDRTLAELEIDDKQQLTTGEKSATVRDLLMARSGIYHPAAFETPRMFNDRPQRGQYAPGEHWFYNNWDFNVLNTIFEKSTGHRVADAFDEAIAGPLGMENFSTSNVEYIYDDSSDHPAVAFSMSAADLSKFGLLMLNGGNRGGLQLIPTEWVRESTQAHTDLGMFGGYGYSWWAALNGDHLPRLKFPDGTYSARGTGEQMLLILPSLSIVWVHVTRVMGPDQEKMHVSDSARLLEQVLNSHIDGGRFRDPRFRH